MCVCVRAYSYSGERGLLVASQEGNYCRNPDKDKHGPWCYTNNSAITWDYCHVKPCEYKEVCGFDTSDTHSYTWGNTV